MVCWGRVPRFGTAWDLRCALRDPASTGLYEDCPSVAQGYISGPYFSPEEAIIIKATLISLPSLNEIPEFEFPYMENPNEVDKSSKEVPIPNTMTIEAAIKSRLQNFFEERRASGYAVNEITLGLIWRAT